MPVSSFPFFFHLHFVGGKGAVGADDLLIAGTLLLIIYDGDVLVGG